MRAQGSKSPLHSTGPGLAAAAATLAAALCATLPAPALASPDDEIVECKLPPQIRSLGSRVTYLAAGRRVRVSVDECRQRGGSWNGRGPGAYAGGGGRPLAVTVGGDGQGAACPLQATVQVSGSLSVRAGPGTGYARVDRLRSGTRVFACDRSGDAGWVGIVYGDSDCGLAAPITPPRGYDGACRSGWVRSNYLR